jgi:hypothetical protein
MEMKGLCETYDCCYMKNLFFNAVIKIWSCINDFFEHRFCLVTIRIYVLLFEMLVELLQVCNAKAGELTIASASSARRRSCHNFTDLPLVDIANERLFCRDWFQISLIGHDLAIAFNDQLTILLKDLIIHLDKRDPLFVR